MTDALFLVLIALYAVVATKVDQWFTISRLGFKSYTPQGFIERPGLYHKTRVALFASSAVALIFAIAVPWYFGAVALAVVGLGAFWVGRKLAFSTYRQIHRELIEYESDLKMKDPEEYARLMQGEDPATRRAALEKDARMTDEELVEVVERSMKGGI